MWKPYAAAVLIAVSVAATSCSATTPPTPPPSVNYAGVQDVGQVPHMRTFCLAPPGSGLRVFESGQIGSHSYSASVVDVRGRPRGDVWSCP